MPLPSAVPVCHGGLSQDSPGHLVLQNRDPQEGPINFHVRTHLALTIRLESYASRTSLASMHLYYTDGLILDEGVHLLGLGSHEQFSFRGMKT